MLTRSKQAPFCSSQCLFSYHYLLLFYIPIITIIFLLVLLITYLRVCLSQDVTPLQIVYPDTALRLQALLDFEEEGGEKRVAGDEWLFEGPGTTAAQLALALQSFVCQPELVYLLRATDSLK